MEIKKLVNADDYQEAWRLQDAGEGWIAYGKDVDHCCPSDVIGFDGDLMSGGVGGLSDTEIRLAGFLVAIQADHSQADLDDVYAYAERTGISVEEDQGNTSVDPVTEDMLNHERYLLDDPQNGDFGVYWRHTKEKARFEYALLVYCLHRQGWAKRWVGLANKVLLELGKQDLDLSRLSTLKRLDPLIIERTREYKKMAQRVPNRLRKALLQLGELASENSAVSPSSRSAMEREFEAYKSFLEQYKERRKLRCETIAKHHLQAMAGELIGLLREPRGRPSIGNLARRAAKAVFVALADEMIQVHDFSMRKATLIAGQITSLLFPSERATERANPFGRGYAKNLHNEYKYTKKSLESV